MENIYVVVTAYNEAKYIGDFLGELLKKTKRVVIVDDGSSDKTAEVVGEILKREKYPQVILLKHEKNRGKGAAMRTGADYAFDELSAQAVIFMDGDNQHHPEDVAKFKETLTQSEVDLVFGVRRFGNEMPLVRVIGNRVCSFLVYMFFGKFIYDIPSGFKAMTKKGYEKVRWIYNDYTVELDIAVRAIIKKVKYNYVEISTIYHDMDRGMGLDSVWKMGLRLVKWKVMGVKNA